MSQENVHMIRRANEALNCGDIVGMALPALVAGGGSTAPASCALLLIAQGSSGSSEPPSS